MNKLDISGFLLKEGLELLKEKSCKKIKLQETISSNKDKRSMLSEPRIIRCTEDESDIIVVVSYF